MVDYSLEKRLRKMRDNLAWGDFTPQILFLKLVVFSSATIWFIVHEI